MNIIEKKDCKELTAPGRLIYRVFARENAAVTDCDCTVGYATYAQKLGGGRYHSHEEEIIYVVASKDAYIVWYDGETQKNKVALRPGQLLRSEKDEKHGFMFDSEEGFVDILFFYGIGTTHVTEWEEI